MISKCLFPVAGYGARFLPATKAIPNEMLPIVNRPLIQYAVEEAFDAGIREMAFVTGRNKQAIEDHFDISYEIEHEIQGTESERRILGLRKLLSKCTFAYTRQKEIKGLGYAVLAGEPLVGGVPFGLVLADNLCINNYEAVLAQMIKAFERYQCSIVGIIEVPTDDVSSYGIVDGVSSDENIIAIETMIEKPSVTKAPSNLAIIGRYVLTPDIFDILHRMEPGAGGEMQLTDALNVQAREGRVLGYKIKGARFDCGNVEGFMQATDYVYRHRYHNR